MFAAWVKKKEQKQESRQDTFVPRVEGLEDRVVPSALRVVAGFDSNTLGAGFNSSAGVNLGFPINFYGNQTSSVIVNQAGNLSFNTPIPFGAPLPTSLPLNTGQPIMAAFWAGVDTSGAGAGTVKYGRGVLLGFGAFGVTWTSVGFNAGHATLLDTFQMIIINRSDTGAGNFDVEFNYSQVKWDSADDQGGTGGKATGTVNGTAASVGFTAGSGLPGTFFILPNSHALRADPFIDTGSAALVGHSLNASTLGRYHFFFRNGKLITGTTNNVGVYNPFRYVYNAASQLFTGNLTLVNRTTSIQGVVVPQGVLDESTLGTAVTGSVTVVFTSLPRGVSLANATGTTASGHPFITVNLPAPFTAGSTLRIPLAFRDPLHLPLPNFFDSTGLALFLGTFNPAVV